MSHRPDNEPTALYRLYDADEQLLYLGISFAPDARWEQHSNDKHWAHQVVRRTVEWYPTRPAALAAEALATAAENPRYDSSWRKGPAGDRPERSDLEGQQAVKSALTREIEQGHHWVGKVLMTGATAKRFGVARATAAAAMHELQKPGLLQFRYHGRFRVLVGPTREEFERRSPGPPVPKKLHGAYQVWTVAELREAMADLPDGLRISARLAERLPVLPEYGPAANEGDPA
ncbi:MULTISPECIES: GntR family transcriptional regulator [Streptomyces]|uniref:GntR family transcriptional regulator n=1 Tax=Streptomyces evansiae TaxID=3075535 RepID=A0ABU2RBP8_9ACTN|nr:MULTISPECIES: GntR family transcriptional regulator [unclassified Streptomyces]MDT0412725.1 GntR family transcriptional regulator [Streptomyces sp. DSM 41979]MYQ56419.1 GntR family transcriptional regulator [Streptomyces sp. SID4926]SCE48123.1 regulatory protein, gntR family [Streptomyces sp. DfronAA-171]